MSPLAAGLRCRCPACGKGRLFVGFLAIAPRCEACGEDLAALEQGDGPAVFVILILGFLITAAAVLVEARFAPPLWVHAVIWPPLIIAGSLALLRPLKGAVSAQHYRYRKGHEDQ